MPKPRLTITDIRASDSLVITRSDVASALGVDPRTVTASIETGAIPSVRLGRRVVIPRIPFLELFGALTEDDLAPLKDLEAS